MSDFNGEPKDCFSVPFLCELPDSVVCDIIQYTPFISWGNFVLCCKSTYAQFAQNKELGSFLYRKISFGPSCRSLSLKLSKHPDPVLLLSGLQKYLQHAVKLELVRQKFFNDFCLRLFKSYCPQVTSLTLVSCPLIRGGLGLTSYRQATSLPPINGNTNSNDATPSDAPSTADCQKNIASSSHDASKLDSGINDQQALDSTAPISSATMSSIHISQPSQKQPPPNSDSEQNSGHDMSAQPSATEAPPRDPSAVGVWLPQLKTLSITACALRESEFMRLAPLMGHLTRLELKSCLLQNSLSEVLRHARSLKHLSLDGCWKPRTIDMELAMAHVPESLESLSLKSCENVTDLALSRVLSRCGPNLKTLNVKFNARISASGLEVIRLTCNLGNLKYLALANLNAAIPATSWVSNVPNWVNVEYLDLSMSPNVDNSVVEAISKHCKSVTNLNLRSTAITEESISLISNSMRKLLYLDVSACLKLQSMPDVWLLSEISRISCPECPALSLDSLHSQFSMIGQTLKFVTKYDLSFTGIDDLCVVSIVEQGFWLSHLSLIGCSKITDVSTNAIYDLLCNPRHTAVFFSLGVCKTPLVTDASLRRLKLKFAIKSLKTIEYVEQHGLAQQRVSKRQQKMAKRGNTAVQPDATSSTPAEASTSLPQTAATFGSGLSVAVAPQTKLWNLPEEISSLPEDSITISCHRGGKCQTKSICQC